MILERKGLVKDFLDNIQDVITKYLLITGFSVGISDLIADETHKRKWRKLLLIRKRK